MSAGFIDEEALEEALASPDERLVERLRNLPGDILLLGAGGKMGPTMAWMARRAADRAGLQREVIAVSRFSDPITRARLERRGVRTIACDLLDEAALAGLPDAPNVVYLAGMKFGTAGREPLTWAMNSDLPGQVCRRWRRSRIVALSTGNVYGLTPLESGGARESDAPEPAGEYAMSCLGRERIFQHFSVQWQIPTVLVRLNYAAEPRYGVLADIGRKVWRNEAVDLSMGAFNTIWQGDANALVLALLTEAATPAEVFNLTGPSALSTREVAEAFGRRLGRAPTFTGVESETALLSDSSRLMSRLWAPAVAETTLIEWIAGWIEQGGGDLGKPTHFEVRDGRF